MTVIRRRAARHDLDEIAAYIGRDSVAAAERFLTAAQATFDLIANFPGAGTWVQTPRAKTAGVRRISVRRHQLYVVYYLANDVIEILRVIHASRDRDAILEDEF